MARPSIFQPRERVRQRASQGDTVGRFRSGYQMNDRPVALDDWRVTTGDPEVADQVNELLGGDEPQEWEAKGEDNIEVFTTASQVKIILDDEKAIDARMIVWPPRGQDKFLVCGGEVYETENRRPYECTDGDYSTKAEHDEQDHICKPQIKIRFRLADAPEMGHFEFHTGSWSLTSDIGAEIGELYDVIADNDGGPALATLTLEPVSYTDNKGKKREFTKPVLTVNGPAEVEDE